jgi:hypothetical protein
MKNTKDSTIIEELIRQALDVMLYKLGDRPLHKHEVLGVSGITYKVILRGNTNLEAYGWAIYSGRMGTWQVTLNHNRFVRGTPKQVQLGNSALAMLNAIPAEQGLYRMHSHTCETFSAEQIREITEPPVESARQWRA